MTRHHFPLLLALLAFFSCAPRNGVHTLKVLTTNDVHGAWFDSTYVGNGTKPSLMAVNHYVDSIRAEYGKENVLLLDAGDCLQGDNAAYYYNYVNTEGIHPFVQIVDYMGYDAVAVGNHDIEAGHPVYDRVAKQLKDKGIAFLGGNAVRTDNGDRYFDWCKIFHRAGMKVAVLGYTNPNIKAWLAENVWSGMDFKSLIPLVQEDVDRIIAKKHPDVVIVDVHSGTGLGDGSMLESQGLDLLNSLHGVDLVVCSHDHRPVTIVRDSIALVNSGSKAHNIGVATITMEKGKKTVDAGLLHVDKNKTDATMRAHFSKEYNEVKAFTNRELGALTEDLRTRDSYFGPCAYMDVIHGITLSCEPAQISFAAPLTYNRTIEAGTIIYNDLFTIYPFENQVFVVKMTGEEIHNYLEYSYGLWLSDDPAKGDPLLKIVEHDDPRNGQKGWSFVNRSYNFDSAAGINYEVDVQKPAGERVKILSLADGQPFGLDKEYSVGMTSYRSSGAGGLVPKGAGISPEEMSKRVVARHPEVRVLLYNYLEANKVLDPEAFASKLGHWSFVPEKVAATGLDRDRARLFGEGK